MIKKQLDKITEAILASEGESTPLVFARKAREIEVSLQAAERKAEDTERDLANTASCSLTNENEEWVRLAKDVEDQEIEARLQARQLVADTFERIVVWHHGMQPDPDASERDYCIDLLLLAKGRQARTLRIDQVGKWVEGLEGTSRNPV